MGAHWNGEKELRFIRMLCEREDGRRGGTGLNDMKVRVGVRPSDRYEHLNELTMGFKLGRGVPVELFEAIRKGTLSAEDLEETIGKMLDGVEEIDSKRDYLLNQISELRSHLSRCLTRERRKGAYVSGTVGLGRLELRELRDAAPVVSLDYLHDDLRMRCREFVADRTEDIDSWLEAIREDLLYYSSTLDILKAKGSVGQIHPLLLHALEIGEFPLAETIQSWQEDKRPSRDIGRSEGESLIVYWHRGTMTGTFGLAEGIKFEKNSVTLRREVLAIPKSAKGKDLGRVLAIPSLEGKSVISEVWQSSGGYQTLWLDADPIPFDEKGSLIC